MTGHSTHACDSDADALSSRVNKSAILVVSASTWLFHTFLPKKLAEEQSERWKGRKEEREM